MHACADRERTRQAQVARMRPPRVNAHVFAAATLLASTYEEKIQRRSAFVSFACDLRGRIGDPLVGSLSPRASELHEASLDKALTSNPARIMRSVRNTAMMRDCTALIVVGTALLLLRRGIESFAATTCSQDSQLKSNLAA